MHKKRTITIDLKDTLLNYLDVRLNQATQPWASCSLHPYSTLHPLWVGYGWEGLTACPHRQQSRRKRRQCRRFGHMLPFSATTCI